MSETKFHRVLSLWSLVFYGLAFMVPLTLFTTYGLASVASHGMVSLSYMITTLCMLFIALSYAKMTKVFSTSGSVYTFVLHSMNSSLGFLSGWAILIGYVFLPMLNFLISAIYLHSALPQIPQSLWIILMASIVLVINHFGIQITDIFNKSIVLLQALFLAVFFFIVIKYIFHIDLHLDIQTFIHLNEFSNPLHGISLIFSTASILALSFLGFDAIATLSEEAMNPKRNIPKAIILSCLFAGVSLIIMTYILELAWSNAWYEIKDPNNSYEVIERLSGNLMAYFFTFCYCIGTLASSVSSVASASRILYGMGKDGILPRKFFGYLNPKYKTPTYSIILICFLSLSSLFVSLSTATALLNFGALVGFFMVNLSVISYYFFRLRKRSLKDIVRYFILPIIGAIFTFILWIGLDRFSMLLGGVWLLLGFLYLVYITKGFSRPPLEIKSLE